jgi:hypothetical protein
MDFRVGDFVVIKAHPTSFRIITHLVVPPSPHGWDWSKDFGVLYLLDEATGRIEYVWAHGTKTAYEKVSPTKELVESAKAQLKKAYKIKRVDNLTFIEITARLKEYESQL